MTKDYQLRRIFKSENTGTIILKEIVQYIFISELINPSEEVWFVSPFISDVPILDNRAGNFNSLNPEWNRKIIKLSDYIRQIISNGSKTFLVTKEIDENMGFLNQLDDEMNEYASKGFFSLIFREKLHTKGILTNSASITGSMNLTWSGFNINDESIEYDIDPERLSQMRQELHSNYLSIV